MSFLENNFFLLAITFGIFFFAKLLQKKTGLVLLNPILLTIALLIIFLKMTNISYETYNKGAFTVSNPASSQAFLLRCPDTISYRPSSFGRRVTGVMIPRSLMLWTS